MTPQDATNFLVQYLKDSQFEGDIENGTALYDLLIKPMSVLYSLFKYDVDKAYGYLSLNKAQELKAVLGSEYDTAIDSILSNWFVTRGIGDTTSGVVRVYFSKPLTSLYIDKTAVFTVNSVTLTPTTYKLYTSSDFTTFFNTVRNDNEYYLDIDVVSTISTSTRIIPGDSVVGYVNSLFYLRSEVLVAFSVGYDPETSDAFIARTKDAITTREMVSEKAIRTVLLDAFPTVTRLHIAGFGDAAQNRDIVTVNNANIHIGNKLDIYVQAALAKKTIQTTAHTTTLDFAKILSVSGNVPYTTTDTTITIPSTTSATVTYLQCAYLASIRNFMADSVICCDIKVNPMDIIPLNINISVKLINMDVSIQDIKHSIADYINNVTHVVNYSMLDMVKYIKNSVPGVLDIVFPITVTANGQTFSGSDSNIKQLYTDDSYITVTVC